MQKVFRFNAFLLALYAAGCAGPLSSPAIVDVPETLRPAAHESLRLVVPAKGVQIYECRADKQRSDVYAWAFVGPQADLYDTRGRRIGAHYAGPHWQSTDGSKISGTMKARAEAPASGAIPWLLLEASSVGRDGAFSSVTSIQRVNTVGGAAPQAGCSSTSAGAIARVDYTADYYFYAEGEKQ